MQIQDNEFEKNIWKQWEENYNFHLENRYFHNFLDIAFLTKSNKLSRLPVVICLSGPSVDNHIEELKKIRDKIVLMSCDTVTFRLNEEGIIPDFVVSIDPQRDFLDLLTHDIDKTPYLIVPTSGSAKLTKEWEGFIFFFNQSDRSPDRSKFLEKLTKPTKRYMTFENKYFIGMTMFQIAVALDLYPVTFLGADFCYTDSWYVKGLEKRRYQGREIETKFDDMIDGNKSTRLFRFYKDTLFNHIEDIVKRKKLKFFDSSDGVLGIEKISLENFAKEYGKDINIKEIVRLKR